MTASISSFQGSGPWFVNDDNGSTVGIAFTKLFADAWLAILGGSQPGLRGTVMRFFGGQTWFVEIDGSAQGIVFTNAAKDALVRGSRQASGVIRDG